MDFIPNIDIGVTLAILEGIILVFGTLWYFSQRSNRDERLDNHALIWSTVDEIPQSVILKDTSSRYLACNGTYAKTFGKTTAECKGISDFDLFPKELALKYRNDDAMVLKDGVPKEFVERYLAKDKERWIYTTKTPVRSDTGAIIGLLVIFSDITSQVEALATMTEREMKYRELSEDLSRRIEERNRQVLDSKKDLELFFELSTDYLCVLDLEGKLLRVAPSWAKGLGYREDELIGKSLLDILDEAERNDCEEAIRDLARGGRVRGNRRRAHRADGSPLWLSWDCTGFPERNLIIAVGHDVTARIESERNLLKAKQEAERMAMARNLFISAMSHELRTPMNAILGYARLLGPYVGEEKAKAYLSSILSAGTSLLDIINDLLDLTRLESDRVELIPEPFDPRTLMDDTFQVFQLEIQAKGLSLNARADEGLPKTILLDRSRVRQIVLNIVGNAVKFTEQGQVTLELGSRKEGGKSADGQKAYKTTLLIRVEDTGIGISEEYRRRLFEPFSQQDDKIMRRYGGTGLGLAIAKRLVDKMGGSIACESEEGQGTRFIVELPETLSAG